MLTAPSNDPVRTLRPTRPISPLAHHGTVNRRRRQGESRRVAQTRGIPPISLMAGCLVPNAPIIDRARLRRFLIWLAAGWGFAIVAHLVHVDWLLLVAILVLTAALIRGGHSLLDRLMVALLLLLGAGITAGLLFTVWP